MQDTGSGPLAKVTLLEDGDSSEAIYDEWAADYDADLVEQFGYRSPALVADRLASMLDDRDATVVDYGCGTGLSGAALAAAGFSTIDGVDLSAGMLDIAGATGHYRALHRLDLTAPLPFADGEYDALVCVGVMGAGHLVPEDFRELIRTVAPGGPILLYGNSTPYRDDDYTARFARLEADGLWTIEATEVSNYMAELTRDGVMVVARRA